MIVLVRDERRYINVAGVDHESYLEGAQRCLIRVIAG